MQAAGHRGLTLVETRSGVKEAIARLEQHPAVEFAEPNWVYQHQAAANDPYVTGGQLWGVYGDATSPANAFGSQAMKAWAADVTGTNAVYVGVIDSGVQWQHPDLVANAWSNRFEIPNDGVDNDRNGFVDDTRGWNFLSDNNQVYTGTSDDHGTHVAGTLAASGGNGQGIAGVNWNVTFIPVKFLGPNGGYLSDAIESIDYLVGLKKRHGLNIVAINNSWGGGGYSRALHDAILRAAKAEILFVVAAGNGDSSGIGINNDITAQYLSNYDTLKGTSSETAASYNAVISVAAIDRNGALAGFSNYGSKTVHLGAPGVGIWSTVPVNGYAQYQGTSMAAPHVTGGLALYASTHPGESANQIRAAILNAVTPTTSLSGKTVTGGRLNLGTVVLSPLPAQTSPVTNAPSGPVKLHSPRLENGQFRMSLDAASNQRVEIQASSDLETWVPIQSVTNGTAVVEITDTPDQPARFYRAVPR
jgi:subtilisin family serine protease